MYRLLVILLLTLGVAGCVTGQRQGSVASYQAQQAAKAQEASARRAVLQEQLQTADCGPYPDNYKQLVQDTVRANLKDPDSAKFNFGDVKPYKAFTDLKDGSAIFHWRTSVEVNAKNAYGGYAGFKTWYVDIRDGKAINVVPMPR